MRRNLTELYVWNLGDEEPYECRGVKGWKEDPVMGRLIVEGNTDGKDYLFIFPLNQIKAFAIYEEPSAVETLD